MVRQWFHYPHPALENENPINTPLNYVKAMLKKATDGIDT